MQQHNILGPLSFMDDEVTEMTNPAWLNNESELQIARCMSAYVTIYAILQLSKNNRDSPLRMS